MTSLILSLVSMVACASYEPEQRVQELLVQGFESTKLVHPNLSETQFEALQTLSGLGEPGAQVRVFHHEKVLCASAVKASGVWSCKLKENLSDSSDGMIEVQVQKDAYKLTKSFYVPFYRVTFEPEKTFGPTHSNTSKAFLI